MVKITKTLICLLLVLVLTSSFYACSSETEETTTANTTTSTTTEVNTTEAESTTAATTKSETTKVDSPIVKFGKYEQDGNKSNGKENIEWVKLSEKDGKVLLLSLYVLDIKAYHESMQADIATWKSSSLRKWLNNSFYNAAFCNEQKAKIKTTTVNGNDSEKGITTKDNVFLLSLKQAEKLLKNGDYYYAELTPYAQSIDKYADGAWWLIDTYGDTDLNKCAVPSGEDDYWDGKDYDAPYAPRLNNEEGVRPAIWVDKSAI